ncbi:FAD-binding oxidoreductase [Pseudoxanthobacter sp. M-2]|uniref:NAD(P)/FAD-dependent oxidoreductase n=1 Tax=Pseudoxanthobacter sp. M-2 TaxID=3078754 RepID=UPI0038FC621C
MTSDPHAASHPHVIVVGSGIVGASIAWHLARRGAPVTLVDAGHPGGVATAASFAWINASWGNPEPYVRLRMAAMAGWRGLDAELPALKVAWTGGLLWDLPEDELRAFAAGHAALGYDIHLVGSSEAARLEPAVAAPPNLAVHTSGDAAVEPAAAAGVLVAAAAEAGAIVHLDAAVTGLVLTDAGAAGAVLADGTRLPADVVVVAAGVATPRLVAPAGVELPLFDPAGLLIRTTPLPKLLKGLVISPAVHVRQRADGRLLAGADFGGGDPGTDAAETADRVFADLRALLRPETPLALEGFTVGRRPTPADGFPAVGGVTDVPGLFVAVMHSGVTLAPAVGAFLAGEILDGTREPLLAPYRPERFVPGKVWSAPPVI